MINRVKVIAFEFNKFKKKSCFEQVKVSFRSNTVSVRVAGCVKVTAGRREVTREVTVSADRLGYRVSERLVSAA